MVSLLILKMYKIQAKEKTNKTNIIIEIPFLWLQRFLMDSSLKSPSIFVLDFDIKDDNLSRVGPLI